MRVTTSNAVTLIVFSLSFYCCAITYLTSAAGNVKKAPVVLDEESWVQLMEGEWMVDFYAPWCPACKKLEPEWKKFAEWSDDLNIKVASADVTLNPGISGRFMVSGLPTIYHVKDGIFRQYTGARDHAAFINFIEEQKWMHVEPVSKWRAPNTFQMSMVAYAFRISLALRDVHNYLVDHVGLPPFISYSIFTICTVLLGALVGLLIVFVIDQFCPPRNYQEAQQQKPAPSKRSSKKKKEEEEEEDDDDDEPEESGADEKKALRRRNKGNN